MVLAQALGWEPQVSRHGKGGGKAGGLPRGTEPLTSSANARNLELERSHLSVDVDEGSEEREA